MLPILYGSDETMDVFILIFHDYLFDLPFKPFYFILLQLERLPQKQCIVEMFECRLHMT